MLSSVPTPSPVGMWGGAFVFAASAVLLLADGFDRTYVGMAAVAVAMLAEEGAARTASGTRRVAFKAAAWLSLALALTLLALTWAERRG